MNIASCTYGHLFKQYLLLGLIYILSVHYAFTQVPGMYPDIEWQKCNGGSQMEWAQNMVPTADGGVVCVGRTKSTDGEVTGFVGEEDCWITKLDSNGNLMWQKSLGGLEFDHAASVVEAADGSIYVAGYTGSIDGDFVSSHGSNDAFVAKISSTGLLLWIKCYGGPGSDTAIKIDFISENKISFLGTSGTVGGDVTSNYGMSDLWLVAIDSAGAILSQKSYGGSDSDNGKDMVQTDDGGYAIISSAQSNDIDATYNHGSWDYWFLKIDSNGIIQYQNSLGGSGEDMPKAITKSLSNGYYINGQSASKNYDVTGHHGVDWTHDFWVVHIDSMGELIWQKSLGGFDDDNGESIFVQDENNIIVGGSSHSHDGDVIGNHGSPGYSDYWMICLDSLGSINWQKCFGGTLTDYGMAYTLIPGNGFMATGMGVSNNFDISGNHGYGDFWTIKLSEPCLHTTYYFDYDGDNYGNPVNAISSCEDTLVGYVLNNLDCNDSNFVINPDGIEICNDLDDDCNTLYDEGFALNVFYADADGDGFGNNAIFIVSCLTEFPGYVELGNDCNDTSFVINPDGIEICNGFDDNCNLAVDEGFPMNTFYFDADGDLFGDQENDTTTCTAAIDGFIIDSTDCDDANSLIFPGAEELFNGIDDNCNQLIDEGVAVNTIITMPFNVFPNPANNELFISFQIPVNGNVALYDLMGNLVLIKPIVEINFIKIDIALLASGNYFLQFTSNAGSEFLGIIQKE